MTIREYLTQIGTTPAEMSAKVVQRMEQHMMTDGDLKDLQLDTVKSMLHQTIEAACRQNERCEGNISVATVAIETLVKSVEEAEKTKRWIEEQQKLIAQGHIMDAKTCDAVSAFRTVINAVQDVFGEENMTEAVIVAAIEAGSYMGWRSIMGPKEEPPVNNPKGRRL